MIGKLFKLTEAVLCFSVPSRERRRLAKDTILMVVGHEVNSFEHCHLRVLVGEELYDLELLSAFSVCLYLTELSHDSR